MVINITDFNYALMTAFLVVNVVTFFHQFGYSVRKHVNLDNIASFNAEKELMHWSLYGSLVLPLFQGNLKNIGYTNYFVYAGLLIAFTVIALVIGTHKQGFNRLLMKMFSSDSKNAERDNK